MWEPRTDDDHGNGQQVHRETSGAFGSLAADLEMAAREADDFPAVADCPNWGSFAEESPPRHGGGGGTRYRSSPHKTSPPYPPEGQPYPYRSSPRQRLYPPHASPPHFGQQGPPPPYPGAPPMYYPPPPAGSPYGYPPYPARYPPHPQAFDAWMSPPTRFPDYPPDGGEAGRNGTPPRRSPPPKKRRSSEWDNNNGSGTNTGSSSPGEAGDDTGSSTPEKQIEPSPFRSPTQEKGSTSKRYKRSPLFQGGTPGIAAYGSWDTPGGTLNAALSDEFSPMGPSFAHFEADETLLRDAAAPEGAAAMPFDAKLDLAASSGEEPAAPPSIRQRPPAASPFSAFVGELSPFPPPPMRGSPPVNNRDQRDFG